ncbi:uncharacterized protein A1O9_01647 [Exophiala aquamarina CBS 119918]|uniref:Kelch repeat protein n=1 Tax=Exophiala aquamarina CBS 119918 TaxID=1182545 RepID=A0A072PU91_9EURO|nr:uncharacterized protein A1O9_01647 [Exophiala aquamarina CBS 119918]KEF63669.1 hypothetical protein A1O9_01647 [Exophiala aquamarina CBS 119918]
MPSEIWSTPAGVQSTSWTLDVSPADGGLSSDTLGPFAPATAFSDSKFYSFGGNVFKPDALPNMTVLSGLVTQDLESDRWENFTASVPAQSPYRTQAKALIVPNFGEQGYFVVVGGENPPTEESFYELGTFMADMSVITMYDIASGTWYSQKTTGDIPPPRSEFCIVGAASSDGSSFEMFVYGGSTNSTYDLAHPGEDGYLSVYALSFPGFQWFKTTSKTTKRRACHTCSVVGKRQFISIGGRQPSSRQAFGQEPDPWVSGIGIFDMTEFAWADTYTADAAAYESPEVVKDYYAASYKEPEWSDNSLAAAFAFTPPPSSTTTGGSSSPTGSNSAPTSGSTESESKRSNTGPIAGGVVGGVAGLAVIVGLGYWLGRRRRVQIEPSPPAEAGSSQDFKAPPVYGSVASMPLSLGPQSNSAVYEAPTSKPRAELASAPQKYESHFVELPVDARN